MVSTLYLVIIMEKWLFVLEDTLMIPYNAAIKTTSFVVDRSRLESAICGQSL